MDVSELHRGVRGWEAQLHDERLQIPEAGAGAGRSGIGWCSRNFAGREACFRCGARRKEDRLPSPRRKKACGHGRPATFVEVLKAEASRVAPATMHGAVACAATLDAPVAMDTSEQQEGIRQRLNELSKTIQARGRRKPCAGGFGCRSESGEGDPARPPSGFQAGDTVTQVGP